MLSFKRGRIIGIVRGGYHDGKKIHVYNPDDKCCDSCSDKCNHKKKSCCSKTKGGCCQFSASEELPFDVNTFISNQKLIKGSGYSRMAKNEDIIKRAMKRGIEPLEPELCDAFHRLKDEIKHMNGKRIDILDGKIEPHMDENQREVAYVAAPAGSGKSFYMGLLMKSYNQTHPKGDIYLFSTVKDDPAFEGIKRMHRVPIEDEIFDNPIDIDEVKNTLCVFDDIDTISDNDTRKEVKKCIANLLETGRHVDCNVGVTSHLINNHNETKTILNESKTITVFPATGSRHAINYCLEKYCGLSKKDIAEIYKLKSRWITVFKHAPMCILSEHCCYVLAK